ncbi:unnamed protein product, partial [Didymodactylos carnosus]
MLNPSKRRPNESLDEGALRLLYRMGILKPNTTTEFRMSDFINDIKNELKD